MKDKTTDYLIIGNSAAGLSAAASIRKNDKNGTISIISSEGYTNYSKPLITYYIAGKVSLEKVYFKSENFYKDKTLSHFRFKVDFLMKEKACRHVRWQSDKQKTSTPAGKSIIPKYV
jgi:NADH dehydrogenase FAD-containing subunit